MGLNPTGNTPEPYGEIFSILDSYTRAMRDHASSVFEVKRRLRREVWRRLDREGIATYPRPCYGHIPNFRGNMTASWKLIRTETFRRATAVLVSPDPAHRLVRVNALSRGKTLLSYTPGLRRGFVLLRPEDVPRGRYEAASSPRGAIRYGVLISSAVSYTHLTLPTTERV